MNYERMYKKLTEEIHKIADSVWSDFKINANDLVLTILSLEHFIEELENKERGGQK